MLTSHQEDKLRHMIISQEPIWRIYGFLARDCGLRFLECYEARIEAMRWYENDYHFTKKPEKKVEEERLKEVEEKTCISCGKLECGCIVKCVADIPF